MKVSDLIKNRLKENKVRYFACDNVSDYISDSEREELILEVTNKFNDVLDSLIIDRENDPNSRETGKRLAKMYINELMEGRYYSEPDSTAFPNDGVKPYEGMIVIRAEIKSVCSHHWQPVRGVAYIGIIPSKTVIGLSKYIRIAQHTARRGTLQEELTVSILDKIKEATQSEDVAVYIEATHGCCENRGVMAHSSLTQTALLSGRFYEKVLKDEFYNNIGLQKRTSGNY